MDSLETQLQLLLPAVLLEPVPVEYREGGAAVQLAGEFNQWLGAPMQAVPIATQTQAGGTRATHRRTEMLARGVYQYKFVVDGQWRLAAGQPDVPDARGLRNHQLCASGGFVRVASFNIRYHNPADGPHAWPARAPAVAALLRVLRPDLLGLQEVLAHQLRDLCDALPLYQAVGVGRDDGRAAGEFAPVLFLRSKFELISQRTLWLSETPDVPGSRSWGAACVRIATMCVLRNRFDEHQYCVCNTHLDHVSSEARRHGVQLVLQALSQVSAHCTKLLMGDFNCTERDLPYAAAASVMEDTRGAAEQRLHQYSKTFCDFSPIGCPPQPATETTIDYIFVSRGVRVLRHCIPTVHLPHVQLSDHRPIVVDFIG